MAIVTPEIREAIIAARGNQSALKLAWLHGVSEDQVKRVWQLAMKNGEIEPHGNPNRDEIIALYGTARAAEIAARFNLSKSAVCGIFKRARDKGLLPAALPQEKRPIKPRRQYVKKAKKLVSPHLTSTRVERLANRADLFAEAAMRLAPLFENPVVPPTHAVGFMAAQPWHCRTVVGRGDDGLALFCGAAVKANSSYCHDCHARHFKPATVKEAA